MEHRTESQVVVFAKNKKEAIDIASKNYPEYVYVRPYKYASKGINFYLFDTYPIQDDTWPSRRWNRTMTDYIDLSGHNLK